MVTSFIGKMGQRFAQGFLSGTVFIPVIDQNATEITKKANNWMGGLGKDSFVHFYSFWAAYMAGLPFGPVRWAVERIKKQGSRYLLVR
jgi:hypothetical protein